MRFKILVLGYSQSGKDYFAKTLSENFGLKYKNASIRAAEEFVFNSMKEEQKYSSPIECYMDRENHRECWYKLFKEYNKEDKCRFVKKMLEENDFYVGLRDREEVEACKHLFDIIVWIDTDLRQENKETEKSFTISKDQADILIDNNGSIDDFLKEISKFAINYLRP